jgi:hypothetical protein
MLDRQTWCGWVIPLPMRNLIHILVADDSHTMRRAVCALLPSLHRYRSWWRSWRLCRESAAGWNTEAKLNDGCCTITSLRYSQGSGSIQPAPFAKTSLTEARRFLHALRTLPAHGGRKPGLRRSPPSQPAALMPNRLLRSWNHRVTSSRGQGRMNHNTYEGIGLRCEASSLHT